MGHKQVILSFLKSKTIELKIKNCTDLQTCNAIVLLISSLSLLDVHDYDVAL